MFRDKQYRIHFIGIGGIGMSGIAELLLNLGYQVTGSDLSHSAIVDRLRRLGGSIFIGHSPENLGQAQVVVVSSAVKSDNVEVLAARNRNIPIIQRAEMLAELMRLKYGIVVAGSHGKTTTTSMLATILAEGGVDPTYVIGGKLKSAGNNAKLGSSDILVAEGDESDGSFVRLSPTWAVITNIDPEHLDHYGSLEKLKETFVEFANKVPFYGLVVCCLDSQDLQGIIPQIQKRVKTYGLSSQADYQATDIRHSGFITKFKVLKQGREIGDIELNMSGEHNVLNALACIAISDEMNVSFENAARALNHFGGIERRFVHKGTVNDIMVIDDYGHHPVEIIATLKAAQVARNSSQEIQRKGRIVTIFQPHRYSRTKLLFDDFLSAFNNTDLLVLTEIYGAGEEKIEGVCSKKLYQGIREYGHRNLYFIEDKEQIASQVVDQLQPGDLVLTLGAGDVHLVGGQLLKLLEEKQREQK